MYMVSIGDSDNYHYPLEYYMINIIKHNKELKDRNRNLIMKRE